MLGAKQDLVFCPSVVSIKSDATNRLTDRGPGLPPHLQEE